MSEAMDDVLEKIDQARKLISEVHGSLDSHRRNREPVVLDLADAEEYLDKVFFLMVEMQLLLRLKRPRIDNTVEVEEGVLTADDLEELSAYRVYLEYALRDIDNSTGSVLSAHRIINIVKERAKKKEDSG